MVVNFNKTICCGAFPRRKMKMSSWCAQSIAFLLSVIVVCNGAAPSNPLRSRSQADTSIRVSCDPWEASSCLIQCGPRSCPCSMRQKQLRSTCWRSTSTIRSSPSAFLLCLLSATNPSLPPPTGRRHQQGHQVSLEAQHVCASLPRGPGPPLPGRRKDQPRVCRWPSLLQTHLF
jgi:hypothetical protein